MCAGATTTATTTPAKTTPLVVPPVDAPAQSTRREEPSNAPYLEGLLQGLLASCQVRQGGGEMLKQLPCCAQT